MFVSTRSSTDRAALAPRAPESAAEPPAPLFRQEAMAEQQSQWLGSVLVAPGLSASLFALFSIAAAAATAAFLAFGHYTQTARIAGWLTPERGVMRVYAPQAGRIAKLEAKEGAEVRKGQPLAVISTEIESEALGRSGAAAVAELTSRRESLKGERERQRAMFDLQARELTDRVSVLRRQEERLAEERALQRSRLAIADQTRARIADLRAKGITTETALQDADRDRLRIAADVQGLERDALVDERDRLDSEAKLRALPTSRDIKLAEIDRGVSALSQEIAEAEAKREIVLTAPQDGVVTGVRGALGGGVRSETPLLSIMPGGSKLTAELFTTSRAIGFIRLGQTVLLRYRAYPYQKFGVYRGAVTAISRQAVSPSELAPQLAGLTSLFATDEPVYRVEVTPDRQTATAYGAEVALQAGMQVEADVLIERRPLYEWMLDPVFALTGRWRA